MLCAFGNFSDLQRGLFALKTVSDLIDNTYDENVYDNAQNNGLQIIQANHNKRPIASFRPEDKVYQNNDDFDVTIGTGFYGIFIPQEKVNLSKDIRSCYELKLAFPNMCRHTVEKLWEKHESWTVCFDQLSSLLSSHGSVVIEEFQFPMEISSWPTLSHSNKISKARDGRVSPSLASEHEGWSVVSLNDFEILSLSDSLPLNEKSFTKSPESRNVIENDWEMLTENETSLVKPVQMLQPVVPNSICIEVVSADQSLKTRSYKDMLLSNLDKSIQSNNHMKFRTVASLNKEWKPMIMVDSKVSYLRVDRQYGNNQQDNIDDDDEDFCMDEYYQSEGYVKGRVALNRVYAMSKMRPAALEKKNIRIAARIDAFSDSSKNDWTVSVFDDIILFEWLSDKRVLHENLICNDRDKSLEDAVIPNHHIEAKKRVI
eukprot:gene8104-10976_t